MNDEHDEHDDDIDDCRPGSAGSGHVVYCVHGNKWGIAQCCDDLNPEPGDHGELGGDQDLVHCHTSRQEGVDKK